MQKLSGILCLLVLVLAPAFPADKKVNIGEVRVDVDNTSIAVRVSANSPELQGLAQNAFNSHGRYRLVGSGQSYDFKFTALSATQVRVDITKGSAGTAFASQVVNGTTQRQALLRAADVAVEKTNGLNLRGFFTARLAFLSQRGGKSEVLVSDLFMGEGKQLTRDGALAMSPRWAPDGSRIIYTSYFKTGAPDIFLLDPNTGRKDTFASFRGSNWGARFSPNGQQVAMILTGEGNPQVYVANAQGQRPSRKTNTESVKSSPCFSPDGSQIVFAMEPGPQLYVMSAAGGTPRRLPLTAAGLGTYAAEPDWSRANPNKIVCTVRSGGGYQIAVFDLTTNKGSVVSKASFDGIEPSWLADGRHVVYTARDRRTSVLSILDTETGRSTRIPSNDTMLLQASVWTP
jgi:TolB protein